MASDIILSSAVRSNLLSLQRTADLLGKTQEKLATGLKVNSALDDPTAFFTASALNSRASDLNRLQDFVGTAVQTLKAADEGISAITNLVESAEAVARQALQTTATIVKNSAVISGSGVIAADTKANTVGTSTISADLANAATVTGASGSISGQVSTSLATLTGASINTSTLLSATGTPFAAGDTITVNVNGTVTTFTLTNTGGTGIADGAIDIADTISEVFTEIENLNAGISTNQDGAGGAGQTPTLVFDNTIHEFSISISDASVGGGANATANQTLSDQIGLTNGAVGATAGATSSVKAKLDDNGFAAGDSLVVTVNGTASTISVVGSGATGNLQVNADDTLETLYTKLDAVAGANVTAAFGAGTPTFTFAAAVEDFAIQVVDASVGGGANATANQTLSDGIGLTNAAAGAVGGLSTSYKNTDLGDLSGSITFTINGSQDVITFGTDSASGEVNTRTELQARLTALSASSNTGATFEISGNKLSVQTSAISDGAITVAVSDAGATGVAAELGVTNGQRDGVNATIDALIGGGAVSLTINDGTNTDTLTFGTGTGQIDTRTELEAAIANALGNTNATLTIGADNKLVVTGDTGETITVGGDAAVTTAFGLSTIATAAQEQNVTNPARLQFANQYNELLGQIDDLTRDAGYNGVNLLQNDSLTVVFNETGSSTLSITGVDFDSGGLGINNSVGAFGSNTSINTALSELDNAKATLRAQASNFGSNLSVVETRQDFTKSLINVLETGAANLTLADTNEEGANLLALQTRQQLSSTALSLASQADQQVLRLF